MSLVLSYSVVMSQLGFGTVSDLGVGSIFNMHHFTGDLANGVRLPRDHPEHVHLLQAQQLHQMSAANVPPHCGCR